MTESCYRHPDRVSEFYCQKDGNYMCRQCACCHSPRIYCQFRTACVIALLTKEGELGSCDENRERPGESGVRIGASPTQEPAGKNACPPKKNAKAG